MKRKNTKKNLRNLLKKISFWIVCSLILFQLQTSTIKAWGISASRDNNQIVTSWFWQDSPSSTDIINALFWDSDTAYSLNWSGWNTCNAGSMTVQNITPWTDTLPNILDQNTIYVLQTGSYLISTGRIFSGNCIAVVSNGIETFVSATIASGRLFHASWVQNIIIMNLQLDWLWRHANLFHSWSTQWFYANTWNNISLINIKAFEFWRWASFGNLSVWAIWFNYTNNILIHNTEIYKNRWGGSWFFYWNNIIINNAIIHNNDAWLWWWWNDADGIRALFNNNFSVNNSIFFNNADEWVNIEWTSWVILNNIQSYKNWRAGINLQNSTWAYLNNVRNFWRWPRNDSLSKAPRYMFGTNITDWAGTWRQLTGSTTWITLPFVSRSDWIYTTWNINDLSYYAHPINWSGSLLNWFSTGSLWAQTTYENKLEIDYNYWSNVPKQIQPVFRSGWEIRTIWLPFDNNLFLGEFERNRANADLQVTPSLSSTWWTGWQEITFTIVYNNTGYTRSISGQLSISFDPSLSITYISWSNITTSWSNSFQFDIGSFEPWSGWTIVFTGFIPWSQPDWKIFITTGSISGYILDWNSGNNLKTVSYTINNPVTTSTSSSSSSSNWGWGWITITPDECGWIKNENGTDQNDKSSSFYDKKCEWETVLNSAPIEPEQNIENQNTENQNIEKLCKYEDEAYKKFNFRDMKWHRASDYVEILRLNCIVKWRSINRFVPDGQITRAELVKIVTKLRWLKNKFSIQKEWTLKEDIWFNDIESWHRATQYFKKAKELLLINSRPTQKDDQILISPEKNPTRKEALTLIMKLHNLLFKTRIKDYWNNFVDIEKTDPSFDYISTAKHLWFISWGTESGKEYFYPEREISRAELSKIIALPFQDLLNR